MVDAGDDPSDGVEDRAPAGGGRVTMADVAERAGVSKITISRALRDSPSVRPETRERIRALAREMGYRINLSARSLRLQRSDLVAVVVEMTTSPDRPLSDPFPMALMGGICQELTSEGMAVLLTTREGVQAPSVQGADGIILLGQGLHDEMANRLAGLDTPLVVWGATAPGQDYVTVGSDNLEGGRLVARHFLARGRRRCLFLGDIGHSEIRQRHDGFLSVLAAGGGALVGVVDGAAFTIQAGQDGIGAWLDGGGAAFDAIFAASDLLAVGALRALQARGLNVPGAVSVAGYDDTPLGACMTPSLTSVHQDWTQGGTLLARKILSMIQGGGASSTALPVRLVVRDT